MKIKILSNDTKGIKRKVAFVVLYISCIYIARRVDSLIGCILFVSFCILDTIISILGTKREYE